MGYVSNEDIKIKLDLQGLWSMWFIVQLSTPLSYMLVEVKYIFNIKFSVNQRAIQVFIYIIFLLVCMGKLIKIIN